MAEQVKNLDVAANGVANENEGSVKRSVSDEIVLPETPPKKMRLDEENEEAILVKPEAEVGDDDDEDVVEPSPSAVRFKPGEEGRYHSNLAFCGKQQLQLDEARLLSEDEVVSTVNDGDKDTAKKDTSDSNGNVIEDATH